MPYLSYEMRCACFYHLCNLKILKNTDRGVLLLVYLHSLACNFIKSNTPPLVFSRFLNRINGTKSCNASHMEIRESQEHSMDEN